MIDVIIAAYNAQNTIEDTLLSILQQDNSNNINVYIVNDNPENNYRSIVEKFKKYINVKELKMPKNMGPGEARNYGIKHSKSEFIIFMDADDIFHNSYSAQLLLDYIVSNNADVIVSSFLDENDFCSYSIKTNEIIWNHGKIYRRSFIEENDVKFSSESTNEDTFFNFMLQMLGANIVYVDDITYVWQKNLTSITRRNDYEYRYEGLESYNNNIYMLAEEGKKRNIAPEIIAEKVFFGVLQMYYMYVNFDFEKDEESVKRLLKASKKNILLYFEYHKYLSFESAQNVLHTEICKNLDTSLPITFLPRKTFYNFLDEGVQINE